MKDLTIQKIQEITKKIQKLLEKSKIITAKKEACETSIREFAKISNLTINQEKLQQLLQMYDQQLENITKEIYEVQKPLNILRKIEK